MKEEEVEGKIGLEREELADMYHRSGTNIINVHQVTLLCTYSYNLVKFQDVTFRGKWRETFLP